MKLIKKVYHKISLENFQETKTIQKAEKSGG